MFNQNLFQPQKSRLLCQEVPKFLFNVWVMQLFVKLDLIQCNANVTLLFLGCLRDLDSFDMRKKLPFCVGLLLRLLKKNHCVYITCTSGLDRSPACVIAYLHWITDTSLHAAYNFVTGLHSCRPDRFLSLIHIQAIGSFY